MCDQELTAGGSVAHTLGVIQGFVDLKYDVICASSCMQTLLKKQKLKQLIKLSNPLWISFLRWKINCFLSSVFFFWQVKNRAKNQDVLFIYQRYSLLNITGVLLKWAYEKKLILEYNGSEAWIATHWITKKRWLTFEWLMKKVEHVNIQNADTLVVVSQALKDELLEQGISEYKILVNPNGVDAQKYYSEVVIKRDDICKRLL
jgi:glycosyltransferase involved in cell wall biosynthesis